MSEITYVLAEYNSETKIIISLQRRHNEHHGISTVFWNFCPGAHQRRHQSSLSLSLVRGIHRPSVAGGFPSQRASNAEKFPFDDITMCLIYLVGVTVSPRWRHALVSRSASLMILYGGTASVTGGFHKGSVMRKTFPCQGVIVFSTIIDKIMLYIAESGTVDGCGLHSQEITYQWLIARQ